MAQEKEAEQARKEALQGPPEKAAERPANSQAVDPSESKQP